MKIGILYMLASTLLFAFSNPLLKKAGFGPVPTLILQVGFSWLVTLPLFLATGAIKDITSHPNGVLILLLVGITNAIGYMLTVKSLPLLSIWQVNIFSVLLPVLSALVAAILLKEPIETKMFVALFFMLVGLFVAFK